VNKMRALAPRRAAGAKPVATRPPATARRGAFGGEPQAVAIGASTGGIHALCLLLGALPRQFSLPILVVQHLPESFMATLARQLTLACGRPAKVAGSDTPLEAGGILVAPGDGHMVVRRHAGRLVTGIAHHAAPSGCTPSVDPLFETLADATGGKAIGVVLSGMGRDGVIGAARLVAAGGTLFAQDAATSAVWGMPRAVAEAGLAAAVLPPEAIAQRLAAMAGIGEALRA
jgi:two-component system chemotaxis response regulator CheB